MTFPRTRQNFKLFPFQEDAAEALRTAALLPTGTKIVRDRLRQAEWRALIDSMTGLTIWLLTITSWNEAEAAQGAGSEEARLNLH